MLERALDAGEEPDPEYTQPPRVDTDLLFYESGFWTLSKRRPVGMDIGAITVEAITGWMTVVGIVDPEEREQAFELIVEMDDAYLEAILEKRGRKSG